MTTLWAVWRDRWADDGTLGLQLVSVEVERETPVYYWVPRHDAFGFGTRIPKAGRATHLSAPAALADYERRRHVEIKRTAAKLEELRAELLWVESKIAVAGEAETS